MKRSISFFLILTMLLGMALTMSGCAGDKKKILGTWKAEIDYTEALNTGIRSAGSAEGMQDMAKYFQADSFILTTIFTFRDDGTYTVAIDETSAENALKTIRSLLFDGFERYMQYQVNMSGLPISVSEYLKLLGTSLSELVDTALTDEVKEELLDGMVNPHTGNYRVADGRIYMTEELDEELTEEYYDTYELDGDTLTLLECHCKQEEGFEDIAQSIYPVVLTRTED